VSIDPNQELAAQVYREFGMERAEARHIIEFIAAAGWVSPDQHRAEVERADDMNEEIVNCRVLEYKAVIARVEALAVEAQDDMDRANAEVEAEAGRPSTMRAFVLVDDLRAALAEPESHDD
jgi:hypothetical protein